MDAGATFAVILVLTTGAVIGFGLKLRFNRRELQHKERLAALEKGAQLPDLIENGPAPWSPRVYLLRGMIWLFAGIGIATFLWVITGEVQRTPSIEARLLRATNLKSLGATDAQVQQVIDDTTPRQNPPRGLALLGLVPIGVGLAYLIYYLAESKNLPLPGGDGVRSMSESLRP